MLYTSVANIFDCLPTSLTLGPVSSFKFHQHLKYKFPEKQFLFHQKCLLIIITKLISKDNQKINNPRICWQGNIWRVHLLCHCWPWYPGDKRKSWQWQNNWKQQNTSLPQSDQTKMLLRKLFNMKIQDLTIYKV